MSLRMDITIDAAKLREQLVSPDILQILRKIRPTWLPENICAKAFTGGVSNELYCYYKEGEFPADVVLFRIEGQGTELMIDRKQERENLQALHAAGLCPPLYAEFNNGIAYGYIDGETVDVNTVRYETVRKLIAKEMCRLHTVQPNEQPRVSLLRNLSFRLLQLSPDGFPDDPEKHKQYIEIIRSKRFLEKELKELWDHLEALNSPIVFCHNDLLLQNIIYNEETGSVHFIDYEYAMYNYEHFEIGNHFCEYSGVDDVDFTRYPDKTYQFDWIRYYLECKAKQNGATATDVTERDIEECYVKTNKFALASYFFWGLWCIVQTKYSNLDFEFLKYASLKFGEYFARKGEFLALQVPT